VKEKGGKESEMQMSDYCYCSVRWIKIRANLALQCSQQCPEDNTTQGIVIQSRPETSGSNGHQLQTKHIKDQTLGSTKELVLSLSDPHVHVSSLSWEHARSHTNTENLLHSLSEAVNVRTNCIWKAYSHLDSFISSMQKTHCCKTCMEVIALFW